ncbi:hypothetical protein D0Z00_002107 [Geotrichum galactomycetum]|uniref:Uncharacterized protein n=1 Tax=Geotrichum galactomycetum TaxID=27317 RepID=A0ACB6V534_9ASCO|nr:hypothetical protein D0Z00_002107 [Geotrichum candidum]
MASSNSLFGRIGAPSKPQAAARKTKKPVLAATKSGVSKAKAPAKKNALAQNSLFQAISGTRKVENSQTTTRQEKKKNALIVKSIDSSVFKDKKVKAPVKNDLKKNSSDKITDSKNNNNRRGRNKEKEGENSTNKTSTDIRNNNKNNNNRQQEQSRGRNTGSRRNQRLRKPESDQHQKESQSQHPDRQASSAASVNASRHSAQHAQPEVFSSSSTGQLNYPQDAKVSYNRPGMGATPNTHSFSIKNASLPPILVLRNLAPGTSMADVRTQHDNTVMAEIVFQDRNMASLGVQQFHGAVADGQIIQAEVTKTQLIPSNPQPYGRAGSYLDNRADIGHMPPHYGFSGHMEVNDRNGWEG